MFATSLDASRCHPWVFLHTFFVSNKVKLSAENVGVSAKATTRMTFHRVDKCVDLLSDEKLGIVSIVLVYLVFFAFFLAV